MLDDLIGILSLINRCAGIGHDESPLPILCQSIVRSIPITNMTHATQDGTRIQSATQSCPYGNVTAHPDATGIQKKFTKTIDLLFVIRRNRFQMIECIPPSPNFGLFAHPKCQAVATKEMPQPSE